MAVGREEDDRPVAEDVVLAVDGLVRERMVEVGRTRSVALLGQDRRIACGLQLPPLDEERRSREELIRRSGRSGSESSRRG
jgi:hypothetical protein